MTFGTVHHSNFHPAWPCLGYYWYTYIRSLPKNIEKQLFAVQCCGLAKKNQPFGVFLGDDDVQSSRCFSADDWRRIP